MARLILVFLALFSTARLPAFDFSYVRYDVQKGLPSSELYDVHQDRNGYIWIASDRGLSRFDGYTFTNFSMKDGLTDNTIFNIWEDKQGRLWLNTFNRKLCYYENGRFHAYAYNDSISRHVLPSAFLRTLTFADDGSLVLGFFYGGLFRISPEGKMTMLMSQFPGQYVATDAPGLGGLAAGMNLSLVAATYKHKQDALLYFNLNGKSGQFMVRRNQNNKDLLSAFTRKNGNYCLWSSVSYSEVHRDGSVSTSYFGSEILRISEDADSCLWLCMASGGAIRYGPNELPVPGKGELCFPEQLISCVYEDKEEGFWVSTLNAGLFYIPSIQYKIYFSEEDENHSDIAGITGTSTGELFIATKAGIVYRRIGGRWDEICANQNAELESMKMIAYDSIRKEIWVGYTSIGRMRSIDSLGKSRARYFFHSSGMVFTPGKTYILQSHKILFLGANNKIQVIDSLMRFEQLVSDRQGRVWAVGGQGLFRVNGQSIQKSDAGNPLLQIKMLCIAPMNDGRLAIGTIDNGLLVYDPKNGSVFSLSEREGLNGTIINAIGVSPDGSLWAATNRGLNHILFSPGQPPEILDFNHANGLPADEIRSIFVSGKEVWLGTRRGAVCFNPEMLRRNSWPPPVYLVSVVQGDSLLRTDTAASLGYNQNSLRFSFVGLHYHSLGRVRYKYLLEGSGGAPIFTTVPQAIFVSVPPGEYRFKVWAINEDGLESPEPAVFSFVVNPPFWKTGWFLSLGAVVVLFVLVLSVYAMLWRVRRNNAQRTQLLEYQQQALSNQMNPHFIFNSLNAVQSYIVREDKLAATKYLSRFSRLIRMSLDHSRMRMVPLSQELSLLRVYLELEAMRFGERLQWSLEIAPGVENSKLAIPAMVIQPYIENAIRHGILNLEDRSGRLIVRLYKEGDDLFCEVEDNGVGRAEAAKRKETGAHRSAGASITEMRLRLICRSLRRRFFLEIKDRVDKNNKTSGTIVKFVLPYVEFVPEN